MKKKTKRLLFLCIGFSLAVHIGAIFFVSHYSWRSFHYSRFTLASVGKEVLVLPMTLLDMAFAAPISSNAASSDATSKNSALFGYGPKREKEKPLLAKAPLAKALTIKDQKRTHISFASVAPEPIKQIKKRESLVKASEQKELLSMIRTLAEKQNVQVAYKENSSLLNSMTPKAQCQGSDIKYVLQLLKNPSTTKQTEIIFNDHKSVKLQLIEQPSLWKRQNFQIASSSLSFPSLKKLHTSSYKDFFDLQVCYTALENGEYLFALTVIPKEDATLPKMKQNVLFLLDKSHSLSKERFDILRHAIIGSLNSLGEGNGFNILAFDNEYELFTKNFSKKTAQSVKEAKKFLAQQSPVSFFTSADIYPTLKYIRSQKYFPQEVSAIVLLTDTELLNKTKNFQAFELWTRSNKGPISFFTVALKGDKNIPLFDFLTQRSAGKVFVANSEPALKRNLQKLIHSIKSPIAKDLSIHAVNTKEVSFCPFQQKKSHLYADQPYTILGTCKSLKNFDFFIQGKNGGEWFNIKKKVSFKMGQNGDFDLSKQSAMLNAFDAYEHYFIDKDKVHLEKAKTLLQPYRLDVAFP